MRYFHWRGMQLRAGVVKPFSPCRGRVFVLPGFTEFIEKHVTTAENLAALGLEVLILDWPGMGLSDRFISNPTPVHIDDFDDYLDALLTVAKQAGFLADDQPLFVFGHSMGGHLALRLAERLENRLSGIIASAPMVLPPLAMARLILSVSGLLCRLGFSHRAVPGYAARDDDGGFRPDNVLTRDPAGYACQPLWWRQNPQLKTAGPTFGWVRAAYASCLTTSCNRSWMKALAIPCQLHLAGDEQVVNAAAAARFLPLLPAAELHIYQHARHELLQELPQVRAMIWQRITGFIEKQLALATPQG